VRDELWVAGGWSVGDPRFIATLEALLAASYRLSDTASTGQAADELAETACALMGADGAHVHVPDELGAPIWANANAARTPAAFHVAADGPDLTELVSADSAWSGGVTFAGDDPAIALGG
jgi:hypothetical protein